MKRYMREQVALLAVGILLGAWPIRAGADEATKSEQEIKSLVNQLGSKQFKEREEAARELSQLGKAALPSLQEAALSPNAELRRRAQQLVERIEPPAQPLSNPMPTPAIKLKSLC
jgi:hypothetical protein